MPGKLSKFPFLILYLLTITSYAEPTKTFISSEVQTTLLELYTSEGCSSCPPADRWMSNLKKHPKLWTEFVPVAFHVDYWDYIGWKDQFAKSAYSERQRQHADQGHVRTVYTPGFLQNAKEWRGWFSRPKLSQLKEKRVGVLKFTLQDNQASASFEPILPMPPNLILNVAALGIDLFSQVSAGENDGKSLHHDFVVLNLQQFKSTKQKSRFIWKIKSDTLHSPQEGAVAVWVTTQDDLIPIQSTGGWLTNNSKLH